MSHVAARVVRRLTTGPSHLHKDVSVRLGTIFTAVFGLLAIGSTCHASVYRCTSKDGSTTYSDQPCGTDSALQQVTPQPRMAGPGQPVRVEASTPNQHVRSTLESMAIRCETGDFNDWVRSQHPLPDPATRREKFIEIANACRRALHLRDLVDSTPPGQKPATAVPPATPEAVSSSVMELREVVVGLNGGSDYGAAIEMTAALQLRVIGAGDPAWTRSNPNWLPVYRQVLSDLRRDVAPAYEAQAKEVAGIWDRVLAATLSPDDINQLLTFYRSATGQRYLAFQHRMSTIQSEATSAATVDLASGGMDPGKALAPSSQVDLDARKQLLALSWLTAIMPSLEDLSGSSHTGTAAEQERVSNLMSEIVAKRRGSDIDQLNRDYRSDLPRFAAFQQSPPAKRLIFVYGELKKYAPAQSGGSASPMVAALQRSAAAHAMSWKAAYEAPRVIVQRSGNVTNMTIAGQLAAKQPITCMPLDKVGRGHTPPDLYQGVSACIQKDDYDAAVALFALAGTESRFDAERVLDKTAGQAGQVLIMTTFNALPEDKRSKFQDSVKAMAADSVALDHICRTIRRMGYPTYYPEYMVLHGIRAFSAKPGDPTMEPNFDSAAAWNSTLRTYLNCR